MHGQLDLLNGMAETRSAEQFVWRPIHYLGSKLRLVDQIVTLLDQMDPTHSRLCDLFAGSGTVSAAVARTRSVTAVDIQEYSRTLCSAVLKPADFSRLNADSILKQVAASELRNDLLWAGERLIAHEARSLEEAARGDCESICMLIESGSLVAHQTGNLAIASSELRGALQETLRRMKRRGISTGSKSVVPRHYGCTYFSFSQSIDIATLLDIVSAHTGEVRDTLLAAVLSTASEIVNTVGNQFAQPIRPRDSHGRPKQHLVRKISRDRRIETLSTFVKWLERYSKIPHSDRQHRAIRADFRDALKRDCKDVGVIYADPPYTRDHYSRFYHVLETMCLGDDPAISKTHRSSKRSVGRGIYRADRHQSPFCIKTKAPDAFTRLFQHARELSAPLLLSHSPLGTSLKPRPRVIETAELMILARKYFPHVEMVSAGQISHSKLNKESLNTEISHNAEVFLVCS